ncbi:hypothetical protein KIL84_007660 [Mauremys mutica]|uniref:Uncharacterized protein n=1 Tax=Mauremys mutica TaxID=74926 RepID=A0A9D3X1Q7_9SAUR|nr:hypothetical protein KIL84_007660 [Mauremys mutica]
MVLRTEGPSGSSLTFCCSAPVSSNEIFSSPACVGLAPSSPPEDTGSPGEETDGNLGDVSLLGPGGRIFFHKSYVQLPSSVPGAVRLIGSRKGSANTYLFFRINFKPMEGEKRRRSWFSGGLYFSGSDQLTWEGHRRAFSRSARSPHLHLVLKSQEQALGTRAKMRSKCAGGWGYDLYR